MDTEIIYLEPDDEITLVIDRLRGSSSGHIALVIPRGSTLAQSIVNLKLLKKSAEGIDKEISLVSNDRIARNLASQTGITVYSKVSEAQNAKPIVKEEKPVKEEKTMAGGFRINSYNARDEEEEDAEEEADETDEDELEDLNDEDEGYQDEEETDDQAKEDVVEERKPEKKENSKEESKKSSSNREQKEHSKPSDMAVDEDEEEQIKDMQEKEAIRKENEDILSKDAEPVFAKKEVTPTAFVKPQDKKPIENKGAKKMLLIIGGVLVVILIAAAFIFVPYTNAKVILKTDDYNFEDNITVDSNNTTLDVDKGLIPGRIEEADKDLSKKFDATGTKDIGTKATGKITVTNLWDSNSFTLPAGSKFVSGGLTFVSSQDTKIPGAGAPSCKLVNGSTQCTVPPGTIDVNVEADKNGESYNLAAGKSFVITSLPSQKQDAITGKNAAAFAGGLTKTALVVTESDLTNAEAAIKQELTDGAEKDLADKVKGDNLIYTDKSIALEVTSSSSNKDAGTVSDDFSYTVRVKVTALAFAEKDIVSIAEGKLKKDLGDSKMVVAPEKAEVKYEVLKSESGGTTLDLNLKYSGKVAAKLNESDVLNKIKNKSFSKAQSTLMTGGSITDVTFNNWPKFYKRTPVLTNRIKVNFDYQQ